MNPIFQSATPPRRSAGSATLSAVVFSAIIMIGLAGVLPMLLSDWKHNSRTSAQEAAFTLAESGIEEAIWAIVEHGTEDIEWRTAGWNESADGDFWYREWNLSDYSLELGDVYSLDEGRNGLFRVIVEKPGPSTIHIVSQGIVRGGDNVPADLEVARYIETQFRKPNPFGYGLIARDGIDFNGRPTFDSYDSRIFPFTYSPGVNSGSEAVVGSVSTNLRSLDLGNSRVFGDIATGAPDNGSDPRGGATVSGDVVWDFAMDFPEIVVPNTSGWNNTAP